MVEQIKMRAPALILVVITAWLSVPLHARAQSETPYDLVNAVNDLRALHGLEPYKIDPALMAYAQAHTEYQAGMNTSTHVHSDGTRPWDIGLQENVASGTGGVVTVAVAVYEIWVDWGHRHILIGYATGDIGAGVAFSDDGTVYYTVDIRPGDELAATVAPFVALETRAPAADGSVVHVVGYGQTLWGIALSYGVTVDDIRRLNGMAADSTVINTGQRLLIRPAGAVTPVEPRATSSMPTEPAMAAAVPITASALSVAALMPSPSSTVAPTGAPSAASPKGASTGLWVALVISIVGLSIAAILGFVQAHNDEKSPAQK